MTAIALVVLQILRILAWAGAHEQPGQFAWRTAAEFEKAWVADGGAKENLPAVDFEKEMVLAVFAGMKNTGGYGITIEKVATKPGKVYVLYRETAPLPDGMVTMAITYPSHVVVVPKTAGEVMFVPANSPAGQEILGRLK
jgi:hypothetical protein